MGERTQSFRLAELVATLSLGTDLGLGQPMEHVIRQTLIALRMSEQLGLDDSERAVVYYSGLLAWVGCHTDAYEQAKWFGDDIALKADSFHVDAPSLAVVLSHLGTGRPLVERARLGAAFIVAARRGNGVDLRNHWLAADEAFRDVHLLRAWQRLGIGWGSRPQRDLPVTFRWLPDGCVGLRDGAGTKAAQDGHAESHQESSQVPWHARHFPGKRACTAGESMRVTCGARRRIVWHLSGGRHARVSRHPSL